MRLFGGYAKNKRTVVLIPVVIFVLSLFFVALFFPAWRFSFVPYGGGWEVRSSIYAVHADTGLATIDDYSGFAEAKDIGTNSWTRIDMDKKGEYLYNKTIMGVTQTIPISYSEIGYPDVVITQSEVSHVNERMEEVPLDHVVDTIEVPVNDTYKRVYDYHIFRFSVTIRTEADATIRDGLIITETSYGSSSSGLVRVHIDEIPYRPFDGVVYVKFELAPWSARTSEGDWQVDDIWVGVMSSMVWEIESGLVRGTPYPEDAPAQATPELNRYSSINMYYSIGGMRVPERPFSPSALDKDIPSVVFLALPVYLDPGLDIQFDAWGMPKSVHASDVYVQYTIRVDVVTVTGLYLNVGKNVPTEEPPQTNVTGVEDYWDPFWAALAAGLANTAGNPWFWIGVVFVVGVIIAGYIYLKRKTINTAVGV